MQELEAHSLEQEARQRRAGLAADNASRVVCSLDRKSLSDAPKAAIENPLVQFAARILIGAGDAGDGKLMRLK